MSQDLANCLARPVSPGAPLESPSLFRPEVNGAANTPAYEIKFLLSEEQVRAVEDQVRGRLIPDPHGDPASGGAYRITSVYTDTPQFDVYRRVEEYGRSKFRVRRYGNDGPVFVERKDKNGDKVRKCRASVPAADLTFLASRAAPADWVGAWFHQQLAVRRLAPVCRISYERIAYLGMAEGATVRLTFDRMVRGQLTDSWELSAVGTGRELLPELVVCEFKYRSAMPLLFKEIVESLGLNPTACSKYRRFVQWAGVAPDITQAGEEAAGIEHGGRPNG